MSRFMPAVPFFILVSLCLLLSGCAGSGSSFSSFRGLSGGQVVSSARPAVSLGSPLPLLAVFQGAPTVNGETGPVSPMVWGAVYGSGEAGAPMAVVTLAEAPGGFEWNFPPVAMTGHRTRDVLHQNREFTVGTRIVPKDRDPFGILAPGGAGGGRDWLARRFTALSPFRRDKIILEYREPLPAGWESAAPTVQELEAFDARAREAFIIAGPPETAPTQDGWLDAVDSRFFTEFLGRLSPEGVRSRGGTN